MSDQSSQNGPPNRKGFLAGIALGTAAAVAGSSAEARAAEPNASAGGSLGSPSDAARSAAAEVAQAQTVDRPPITVSDPGSDFMVDVLKSLDIEYVAVNPGGSIRGLHESILHYGGNTKPEIISVMHEEIGVAMAHGYARATGKPMAALIYGVLGLQHATQAVYNAWVDRVPIVMLAGNVGNQSKRFGLPSWYHSATDLAPLLGGAVKWSDQPQTAEYLADSLHKAYRLAVTPPAGPVLVTLDDWLQENSLGGQRARLSIPTYQAPSPPVADPNALAGAAKFLIAAQHPVLVVDRTVHGQAGMDAVGELAMLLGAPVLNRASRIAIATNHPMNLTGMEGALLAQADVILFLGVDDVWGTLYNTADTVTRDTRRVAAAGAKIITIGIDDGTARGNLQDQQHAYTADLTIVGDPETSLPYLIEALRGSIAGGAADKIAQRAAAVAKQHGALRERFRHDAAFGWDASPVSVARLVAEIADLMRNEDWRAVTNSSDFWNSWPQKLWDITTWDRFQMNSGAGGLGFTAPSAVGARLGNKNKDTVYVALQTDGDFMYVNSVLWTMAHHHIPVLTIMHNNRAYHAEHMNIQRVANRRQRGVRDTGLGTTIVDPPIDYGMLARSMGVFGVGPVTEPAALRPALARALAVVKRGEPALVDVVTQPR